MPPLRALLWTALLALVSPLQSSAHTVPAFVWTSSEGLLSEKGSSAVYEAIDSLDLVGAVQPDNQGFQISGLNSNKIQASEGLVTVLISGKASRATFGGNTRESHALRSSVEAATSSIYLANVHQSSLETGSNVVQLGSCFSGSQGDSLAEFASKLNGQRLTVRVCEDGELEYLEAVEHAISESQQPYLMAYFGQPDQDLERPVGRSLLQSPGSKVLCSEKCHTQVRLFETIILLVILLWALWIGMKMLHILDTPSKFESEKKEQNRHQD